MTLSSAQGRMHEPDEPHGHTVATPHHRIPFYGVFAALVLLTGLTVGVYFLHPHSELVKVLLALAIAACKASLVCLFFMHMKFEGKLIYAILFVPLTLCVLLVCALIPDVRNGTVFNPKPGPPPWMAEHGAQAAAPGTAVDVQ
jgi:cytochrome c oxidase subunit 4